MRTLKIILTVLLVIPISLMIYIIAINPITYERNSLRELTFLVVGLPILMANFFVWFTPDLLRSYFAPKKKDRLRFLPSTGSLNPSFNRRLSSTLIANTFESRPKLFITRP